MVGEVDGCRDTLGNDVGTIEGARLLDGDALGTRDTEGCSLKLGAPEGRIEGVGVGSDVPALS